MDTNEKKTQGLSCEAAFVILMMLIIIGCLGFGLIQAHRNCVQARLNEKQTLRSIRDSYTKAIWSDTGSTEVFMWAHELRRQAQEFKMAKDLEFTLDPIELRTLAQTALRRWTAYHRQELRRQMNDSTISSGQLKATYEHLDQILNDLQCNDSDWTFNPKIGNIDSICSNDTLSFYYLKKFLQETRRICSTLNADNWPFHDEHIKTRLADCFQAVQGQFGITTWPDFLHQMLPNGYPTYLRHANY